MVSQPFAVQRRDFIALDCEVWYIESQAANQGVANLASSFGQGRSVDTVEITPLNAAAISAGLFWNNYAQRGANAPTVLMQAAVDTDLAQWLVVLRRRPTGAIGEG